MGTCDPRNQHKGVMPALPGELMVTGKQAATILEKVADDPETRDSKKFVPIYASAVATA